jgi:hypothetical protein
MGLIDIRRFGVTTRSGRAGKLEVDHIWLAEEDEWDINLAQVVEVNALAVPAKRSLTYRVTQHELRLLLSFLSDHPGVPVSMRRREFKASSGHVKRFVSESLGLGMLTAAVERHYRWKLSDSDLANFDVLPAKLASLYPSSGIRPDLLFGFSGQGEEKRLAGEARGRSSSRPKGVDSEQRDRLADIVAWSGRNDFHPVTMTWAYSGSKKVQVDLFDVFAPEDIYRKSEDLEEEYDPETVSPPVADEPLQIVRERALGRIAAIADQLYETAPEPASETDRLIFGRNVRGNWTTADLVAPSNLRFFLGLLDQPLDREQAGAPRRARNAPAGAREADPIQIAVTQRIFVVVARDSEEEPDWSEVARRIEQPDR